MRTSSNQGNGPGPVSADHPGDRPERFAPAILLFGCPFVSAAVEWHTGRRQAWLIELARRAGAGDPVAVARRMGLLTGGTLASGRMLQDRAVVDEAKDVARSLLAQHTA